ncbi:MAG: type II toxin-antitoxin system VapB family antitoxin [Rhodovibrio sp.]|nr:type II toxin-antitoxin system VapB family antitoxin [Rhodovibrio sp.]
MAEAQALSGAKTKRETVQEALRLLVRDLAAGVKS